jgi:prepilin-type N-terminal cleavage/methylation domain-containing protein
MINKGIAMRLWRQDKRMMIKTSKKGFTLIELVIVIVLLGILASVALPRFLDIAGEAHNASVSGTAGAMASAVNIAHAKWLASGQPVTIPPIAGIDFINSGHSNVGFNVEGWPDAANPGTADINSNDVLGGGGNDNEICAMIMKNLLSSSSVTFGVGENCSENYCAVYKEPNCTYTYQSNKSSPRVIVYSTSNGSITKKLP